MGRTSDARERLVETAARLLHAGGYLSVGVDDLCRAAGVRKGSFYHFFASKQALTLAAMEAQGRGLEQDVLGPALHGERPPLERIAQLFEQLARGARLQQAEHGTVLGCPVGNLAAEVSGAEVEILERAEAVFDRIGRAFAQVLAEARDAGDAPDIDPEANAQALLAYFEGAMLLAKTRNDPGVPRALVPGALALATAPAARRRLR